VKIPLPLLLEAGVDMKTVWSEPKKRGDALHLLPIFLITLIVFAGCTPFKYEESGERSLSVIEISPRTYSISFSGYRKSTKLREFELLLLEASEVAVEQGFEFFAIINDTEPESIRQLEPQEYISTYRYDKTNGFVFRLGSNTSVDGYTFKSKSIRDVLRARYKTEFSPT